MIPSAVRIFVCTERQDMRRSFDALALVVQERLALDPQSGALSSFSRAAEGALDEPQIDREAHARTLLPKSTWTCCA